MKKKLFFGLVLFFILYFSQSSIAEDICGCVCSSWVGVCWGTTLQTTAGSQVSGNLWCCGDFLRNEDYCEVPVYVDTPLCTSDICSKDSDCYLNVDGTPVLEYAKLNKCPNAGFDNATCMVVCDGTWASDEEEGKWDNSEKKCIKCDGKIEDSIYGDTSDIYCKDAQVNPQEGDNACESACGADPKCDEILPDNPILIGGNLFHCSYGNPNRVDYCNSSCGFEDDLCSSMAPDCHGDPACDRKYPGDSCDHDNDGIIDGNCDNNCKCAFCTDSDGGKDYSKKGTCTDNSGSYTDTCVDWKTVKEYYCSGNKCQSENHNCGSGKKCNEGVCVSSGGGGGGGGTTSTSSSTTTSSPSTSSTSTSTTTSTTTTIPTSETSCVDGIDNDMDGKVDCNDPDCAGKPGPNGDNCCFDPTTDCIQYDCAVESCGADHECEYTPVAQCTDNCPASDEWCDGVHLNCINADSSQAVCENCAGGHWDDSGAGDGCCGDDGASDNWCHIGVPGNPGDSCVNGVWHSNHCEDNVHNCDEYTYNGTECVPTVDCGTGGGPLCAAHSVCGPCCSGCNCVNLTIIDRKVSTKTKKENTINLKLKNENYLDTITVELYVKNENDLKTCFGKRCDPWEFCFVNSTGCFQTALVTVPAGRTLTTEFRFTPSGPTPKGLYKIEIGIRNPGSHSSCPP